MKLCRIKIDNKIKKNVERNLGIQQKNAIFKQEFSRPFSAEELSTAISRVKNGKATGPDDMFSEFIMHCG